MNVVDPSLSTCSFFGTLTTMTGEIPLPWIERQEGV
jgi:hypothetical protein